MSLEIYVLQLL